MTDCPDAGTRDLLPLFANGTATPGEHDRVTLHVAGCAACRAELALIEEFRRHVHESSMIDLASVTTAVLRRAQRPVKAQRQRRRSPWSVRSWGTAAAAGFLLLAGGVLWRQAATPMPVPAAQLPLDAHLAAASSAELESLLAELDEVPATLDAEPGAALMLDFTVEEVP